MTDGISDAWAYLSRVAEPPSPLLSALVAMVGPADAAELVRRGEVEEKLKRLTEARREIDSAERDIEILKRLGGRLGPASDPGWPLPAFPGFGGVGSRLHAQAHPPMVLWVVGPAQLDEIA